MRPLLWITAGLLLLAALAASVYPILVYYLIWRAL